jgi:hypothetical protein
MEAASAAVESTARITTMDSATAGYVASAICIATVKGARGRAAVIATVGAMVPAAVSAAISISAVISVACVVAVISVSVIGMMPAPAIPGTHTDKDAARKPGGTVITVRRAGVGIIRVVAPIACGRAISYRRRNHRRPNSHTHRNLSVSRDCRERQCEEHREQD